MAGQGDVPNDEGTPNFDDMSPAELMAWMESLVKRQAADKHAMTDAQEPVQEPVNPISRWFNRLIGKK